MLCGQLVLWEIARPFHPEEKVLQPLSVGSVNAKQALLPAAVRTLLRLKSRGPPLFSHLLLVAPQHAQYLSPLIFYRDRPGIEVKDGGSKMGDDGAVLMLLTNSKS